MSPGLGGVSPFHDPILSWSCDTEEASETHPVWTGRAGAQLRFAGKLKRK